MSSELVKHLLEGWITTRALAPRKVASSGLTASDLEPEQNPRSRLGGSLESTARGLNALAQARSPLVKSCWPEEGFLKDARATRRTHMVAMFNTGAPTVPGPGPNIFGRSGELGLKAILLEVCIDYDEKLLGVLHLVLPERVISGNDATARRFVVIHIDTLGDAQERIFQLGGISEDQYFRQKLGLCENLANPYVVETATGGSQCQYLGFPGAHAYLAEHLPALGKYLSQLARL